MLKKVIFIKKITNPQKQWMKTVVSISALGSQAKSINDLPAQKSLHPIMQAYCLFAIDFTPALACQLFTA